MATHHEIETSPAIRAGCPLLAETASHIGDVQVRNMGTLGGSIAHADPAADYPAALIALEAQVRLVSARSDRTVPAEEFFQDAFATAIQPGEIVLEVQIPAEARSEGYRYEKVAHPASGFAVVGVAVRIQKTGDRIRMARIAVTGMGPRAFRDRAVEKALEDGVATSPAVAALGEGQEANSDLYASAEYRRHLARVHAARAIAVALSRAT
jgi:carbon-monoxide dehydrogenase medium subunit